MCRKWFAFTISSILNIGNRDQYLFNIFFCTPKKIGIGGPLAEISDFCALSVLHGVLIGPKNSRMNDCPAAIS